VLFRSDENGKVFIYKEFSNTKLGEVCERLKNLYINEFQIKNIDLLTDSRKPDEIGLDLSNKNLIQVTYVQAYFDEKSSSSD